MQEVDEESLNMRAIVILISHNHYRAISESHHIFSCHVFLSVLQSHDFDQVLDLIIVIHEFDRDISYIQELSFQGENSIFISANDLNAAHG
jgi:hypothetical protein